jgi:uncharacterized protein (TIGR02466 family)
MNTFLRPLFPKFILSTFYENGITKENIDFLQTVLYKKNIHNNISIDKKLLEKEELSNLNLFIYKTLNDLINNLYKPKNKIEIYITESWLNATKENEQHHHHRHPNSFLSGVFYIKTNLNDSIIFYDDYKMFDIESTEYNDFTMSSLDFNVKDNMLILFPSSVTHCVKTNNFKNTRISIAFNTFLKGTINSEDAKSLNLK